MFVVDVLLATISTVIITGYYCQDINNAQILHFFFFAENFSEISTFCTESGLWQPLAFSCIFDPLAVNLKQGSKIFGGQNLFDGKVFFCIFVFLNDYSVLQ